MKVTVVSDDSPAASGAPQEEQKFAPSGLRCPQFVQNMAMTL